ncbi:MAG: GcrA cell cycle regulator [Magnetovibrio sp.]|nr:GcrA cell cycle regulator [Magnetovibrio sp.]
MEWTADRIKILIAHWEEGLPTSEIGRRLGVTKNSVVGKVHRLGLKKRQSPIRQSAAGTAQPKKVKAKAKEIVITNHKTAPVIPAAPKVVRPAGNVIRLEELTNSMCCWPEGEPGTAGFYFCGEPSIADKPYCAPHCARAYVKVSKDKKRKGTQVA